MLDWTSVEFSTDWNYYQSPWSIDLNLGRFEQKAPYVPTNQVITT